ncbi:CpsD/CapB family tyrosine-protein kinase [bacterium]|nr:CpsD/CapB family tyrosine-protein kinase [candidate division CSSED10-310 bacterium]
MPAQPRKYRKIFLADYESTTDPLAEAFRMLRLQIQTSVQPNSGEKGNIILITSAIEQEGKTTVACNLAQMCAIAHIKTLLIDTDLRKPSIHLGFDIPRKPGVTDILLSDNQMPAPVVKTLVPNLSILPAGKFTRHTTEILGSPLFSAMLEHLKTEYDMIVMDSPPAGVVSDVGVLVRKVDAIYIVVRAGMTKVRTVRQVVRTIKDLGGDILGIILSRINPKRDRYYYYHNYPHYYSSYYKDEPSESEQHGS